MKYDEDMNNEAMDVFERIGAKATEISLRHFGNLGDSNIKTKTEGKEDPVTIADLEVSKAITQEVDVSLKDGVIVLTEETAQEFRTKYEEGLKRKLPIIVADELDGTVNYSHGNPNFSHPICIAQYVDGKYQVTGARIDIPSEELVVTATLGNGVSVMRKGKLEEELETSDELYMLDGITSVNVNIDDLYSVQERRKFMHPLKAIRGVKDRNEKECERNAKKSCAIEVLDVAFGEVDVYMIARAANWDYAAASLILRELGGEAYRFENKEDVGLMREWQLDIENPSRYHPAVFTCGEIDSDLRVQLVNSIS